MSNTPLPTGALPQAVRAHWVWFLVEGIVITLLGGLAIVVPLFAGLAIAIVLGWLLIVAGIVGLFATINARHAAGFSWAMISAVVALAIGVVLLWNPAAGLVTLTLALIAYFAIDGVVTIVMAITHRRDNAASRWEWMLVNGVIDLVLAAIIFAGLPGTLTWALGLLVGIDLIFGGMALVAMALAAKRTLP